MKRRLEHATMGAIGLGVAMLVQPFSLGLYGWSFAVILGGTIAYTIASKLPG